jgi:hypothetical protein
MASLKRRYDQPGIQTYIKLESILLKPVSAVVGVEAVVEQYPGFDGNTLHFLAQADDWDRRSQRSSLTWIQLFGVFSHKSSNLFVCC